PCQSGKSVGIRDNSGELVIRRGTQLKEDTFTNLEQLEKLDYTVDWVEDKKKNALVSKIYANFIQKQKDVEEYFKHEKTKIMLGDELPSGIVQLAKVYVAKKRKLSVGDKMAGRHGNKGVVAKILAEEDVAYLPDGQPIEIVLNPLGVPSRMNIGQVLETHLGWAAQKLGYTCSTPVFAGATVDEIKFELRAAGLPEDGKTELRDGRTGEAFDQRVCVGYIYMLKLSHLVD